LKYFDMKSEKASWEKKTHPPLIPAGLSIIVVDDSITAEDDSIIAKDYSIIAADYSIIAEDDSLIAEDCSIVPASCSKNGRILKYEIVGMNRLKVIVIILVFSNYNRNISDKLK